MRGQAAHAPVGQRDPDAHGLVRLVQRARNRDIRAVLAGAGRGRVGHAQGRPAARHRLAAAQLEGRKHLVAAGQAIGRKGILAGLMRAGELERRLEIARVAGDLRRVADHRAVGLRDPHAHLLVRVKARAVDVHQRVVLSRRLERAVPPHCQPRRACAGLRLRARRHHKKANRSLPAMVAIGGHLVAAIRPLVADRVLEIQVARHVGAVVGDVVRGQVHHAIKQKGRVGAKDLAIGETETDRDRLLIPEAMQLGAKHAILIISGGTLAGAVACRACGTVQNVNCGCRRLLDIHA